MTITALPVLNRTDATFKADVDTFFGTELPQFSVEAEAARVEINANTVTASAAAVAAAADALTASAAVTAATATANAVRWVSGTTYALDVCAISPANSQTYRRKVAGAGTTDPSLDATNWVKAVDALPVQTGNAGKFLTTNGTAESWGAVPAPGLTLLATLTPTAAANVDALNVFSSTYDDYLITIDGVKNSTGRTEMRMRFAVAGAVDAGANYATVLTSPGTGAGGGDTFGWASNTNDSAGNGCSANFHVANVNASTGLKTANAFGWTDDKPAGSGYKSTSALTAYFANNAVSGIRFYWGNGANFAAQGAIRIYGYAK